MSGSRREAILLDGPGGGDQTLISSMVQEIVADEVDDLQLTRNFSGFVNVEVAFRFRDGVLENVDHALWARRRRTY